MQVVRIKVYCPEFTISHIHTHNSFQRPSMPPATTCPLHAATVAKMFHVGGWHAENREHKSKKSQAEKKTRRARRIR